MDPTASTSIGNEGLAAALVVAVFLAGLRHGFDIDHIVAISDITSSQTQRRRSLLLATSYVLGHALVLSALGVIVVLAGDRLPPVVDAVATRVVGLSLILLGAYVIVSLIRFRRDFRMRSRWMLLLGGVRRVLRWVKPPQHVVIEHSHEHRPDGHHHHDGPPPASPASEQPTGTTVVATDVHAHMHTHVVPMPSDPFTDYGVKTSFLVGMVHGVGAETPTQLLLFTTAAGVAGTLGGVVLVAAFVVGLVVGNSVLALLTTVGFGAGRKLPSTYLALAGATAALSIYVGALYLFGA